MILITAVIIIFLISVLFPVRRARERENIEKGFLLEVEQTTGPWWRVKEVIEETPLDLNAGDLVYIKGFDPYLRLRKSVITSFQNTFYFEITKVEYTYDEQLSEEFKTVTVENWGICYPVKRESGLLSFGKSYLNIYDFKWN